MLSVHDEMTRIAGAMTDDGAARHELVIPLISSWMPHGGDVIERSEVMG